MTASAPRNRGFSLIELMVALTIGLIIVAAMLQNLTASSGSNRTNARVAEFQTNGRFAADFLRREIQHAGFAGLSWTRLTDLGTTGTTDYGCGTGFAANIAQAIWGANDSNPFSGSCIPTANYARGDILVLRRAGLDPIPAATTLAADTLYFRSEYLQGSVFLGPTRPANLQVPFADYLLETDVYYISSWTKTVGDNIPALYRMTLGPGPAMTAQLVASNIENMQVQYGVVTGTGIDGSPLVAYYNAGNALVDWNNVVAVRLWLLARSSDVEPGYTNTTGYTMGDLTAGAPNDGFQRQVFPLVVQVRK
jgi:type IV pilus assembly protein PilW